MTLVSQRPYDHACQHACLAMLAGVSLNQVIDLVGYQERLKHGDKVRVAELLRVKIAERGVMVEGFGNNALGALVRKHPTLWLGMHSSMDMQFGHAVLLHEGTLYDPWSGVNPAWPWHQYVSQATPVTPADAL